MKNIRLIFALKIVSAFLFATNIHAATPEEPVTAVDSYDVAQYIKWYPAIKQVEMRDVWLKNYKMGEWQFSGAITADDKTVVSPQAGVNYGYSWFNISNEPVVITMPGYDKYYSVSIFDMNHFMQVRVMPKKPVVIRMPHQKSPIEDAHEIVLQTYQGLAFTRQVMVDNEKEVMELANKITITGGGGDFPFVIPDFSKAVEAAGLQKITDTISKSKDASKAFVSPYEGGGDLNRAGGVLAGQLGTQARYVQYGQMLVDQKGKPLNGKDNYEIIVPKEGLVKNDKGYWTMTIYSTADRYLIPNKDNKYYVSSYNGKPNADGSYTIQVNPEGIGKNALPSAGVNFYGVFRIYEPVKNLEFPTIINISNKD